MGRPPWSGMWTYSLSRAGNIRPMFLPPPPPPGFQTFDSQASHFVALKTPHPRHTLRGNSTIHRPSRRFRGSDSLVLGRPADWPSPFVWGTISAGHRCRWQNRSGIVVELPEIHSVHRI